METQLEKARDTAWEIAIRAEGIAHLIKYFRKDSFGDADVEEDAMWGISLIIEDLSKQSRSLSSRLDELSGQVHKQAV